MNRDLVGIGGPFAWRVGGGGGGGGGGVSVRSWLVLVCVITSTGITHAFGFAQSRLIGDSRLVHENNDSLEHSMVAHNKRSGGTNVEYAINIMDNFTINAKPEALVISDLETATVESIRDKKNDISDYTIRSIDDGTCTMKTLVQRQDLSSQSAHLNETEKFTEVALICSQVNSYNYDELIRGFSRGNNLTIQRLHFDSSESQSVFMAINLACDLLDCSRLIVFNITDQEIHDYKLLANKLISWTNLEYLDLSNTSLKSMKSILPVDNKLGTIVLKSLTHLYLDENDINELDFDFIFERMPKLKHLSLSNNTIYNIYCNESLRSRINSQFESINLVGNVIKCDKSQFWLLEQFQNSTTNIIYPDHDKINCSAPSYLNDMTWSQRVSVLETKICEDCACRPLKKSAISVDCHNKNLTSLPGVLPLNTKILNLTSNHISSLAVPENSKNWENVTYVYLENNLISSFQQLEVNSKFMRNLAALDIRRNRFQEFPSHILEQFINLDQVHLSNNPWLCDCESTFAFQEWLQRQFHKVGDKEEIRCGLSGAEKNGLRSNSLQQRLSSRVIYKLSKSELCPQDSLEEPYDWLDILNLLLGITIILILVKVVMDYIYQHRTKRLPHFFKLNI